MESVEGNSRIGLYNNRAHAHLPTREVYDSEDSLNEIYQIGANWQNGSCSMQLGRVESCIYLHESVKKYFLASLYFIKRQNTPP